MQGLRSEGKSAETGEIRKRLEELSWEGQPVPVRNPELVDVFLKIQDAEARLEGHKPSPSERAAKSQKENRSKKGVAAYDAILLALSDAEEVARKLVEAQQVRFTTYNRAAILTVLIAQWKFIGSG